METPRVLQASAHGWQTPHVLLFTTSSGPRPPFPRWCAAHYFSRGLWRWICYRKCTRAAPRHGRMIVRASHALGISAASSKHTPESPPPDPQGMRCSVHSANTILALTTLGLMHALRCLGQSIARRRKCM